MTVINQMIYYLISVQLLNVHFYYFFVICYFFFWWRFILFYIFLLCIFHNNISNIHLCLYTRTYSIIYSSFHVLHITKVFVPREGSKNLWWIKKIKIKLMLRTYYILFETIKNIQQTQLKHKAWLWKMGGDGEVKRCN